MCRCPRRRRLQVLCTGGSLILSAAGLAAEPAAADLPLEKVVLFTSGVGYFQHGGKVTGDATVEMSFRAEAINDLLKSMVVEDLGGGTVPAVSYASRDPITKTLGTFAIDLTDDPSIGRILGRLRGERIEVEAAAPAVGTIVGIEKRTVPVGDDRTVEKEFITLLTAEGLRTLPLDGITRIRLLDEKLQKDLEQALAVLALGHDSEKKSVSLAFAGEGERAVRVGYVQEAPTWKTSYRLVLGENGAKGEDAAKAAGRALLQGWAIVENTTDRDWKDVRMALVSGRPISFVMDLYQPLYVPRPVIRPELYASLAPQVYGQDMAAAEREFARRKVFEIKNSGGELVKLLVEHPLDEGWKLVAPEQPAEKTRDRYRFAVEAEPGKPATLAVAEERLVSQQFALTNLDLGQILFYSNAKATSPAVRKALAEVIDRRREIERLAQERSRREQEIQDVGQEQERIRQNMAQLDRGSDLYTRYVQKFAQQEDRVEALRKESGELLDQEQRAHRGLDEMLVELEID
jgi:hypothetical protein